MNLPMPPTQAPSGRAPREGWRPGARPSGSLGTKASSERKAVEAGTAREEKQERGGEESFLKGVMMMTSDDDDGDDDVMIEKASIFES